MPSRFVALLVFLVVLWSAFASEGLARPLRCDLARVDVGGMDRSLLHAQGGSAAGHPLDGQPAQWPAEVVSDLPVVVLGSAATQPRQQSAMHWPPPCETAASASPDLDGPRRPPRPAIHRA